jgi:nucleoside-diphosphate-sugar epimerase
LHVVFETGQVGSQLVDRLLSRGLRVRSVRRSPEASRHPAHETVKADVYDRDAAIRAAQGATVVYRCTNAPYQLWSTQLAPLYRHLAAAAQATKVRLIVLADELRAMHTSGELSVTIGRASDFFGPGADNTTLSHPRAIEQLLAGKTVDVVGDIDQPHSWSYAPDVAEGLLKLGIHPELSGQTLHLPVLPAQTGRAMLTALAAELNVPIKLRRMPNWMLNLAGWLSPMMRELPEIQYQL